MEYETPLSYLKRLLTYDESDKFQIIVDLTKFKKNTKNQKSKKVGKGRDEEDRIIINTTRNKARVISKNINDICQVDPTINDYFINLPKQLAFQLSNKTREEIEEILETLIKSTYEQVQIKQTSWEIYSTINTILNSYDNTEQYLEYEMKSQDEAISFLNTEFHERSIEYLSKHITEFVSSSEICNIDEGIINDVIDAYISYQGSDKEEEEEREARIERNRQIFEILSKEGELRIAMHFLLSLDSEEYDSSMIEYIYENLDDEMIKSEASRVIFTLRSHFLTIIESKGNKTKDENKKKDEKIDRKEIECGYYGDSLSGIIDYLQEQNGPNLEENNILKLSGGGFPDPSRPITNLIKYHSNNMNDESYINYYRNNPSSADGWIEFDFVNKTVSVTSYTIRTRSSYYPRSWRIVGSNDHEHWEEIDRKVNNSKLDGEYRLYRFNTKSEKFYRYVRYVQDQQWSREAAYHNFIYLTRIEFFGSISLNE